jgi:DNA-binding transcriptional ArsR family regulator
MSTRTDDHLSATFVALSDPTRRAILARLAQGDAPASELTRPFRISAPAVSRHLRVLTEAGLVQRRVHARWRIYRLHAPGLRVADHWLSQYRRFWEESLDRLVAYVEHEHSKSATTARKEKSARSPKTTVAPSSSRRKRS